MSILRYASPPQKLYAEDQKVLEDYQAGADAYNARVNAYNKDLAAFNAQLEAYKKQAEAYNKAAAAWNATDRKTPFENFSGYAPRPAEFTATAPTKPADPGFSAGDVEGYMKEAEGRALRRAKAAAAAQQIINAPGQFYVVGRENFGVQPEVSLAGMSGFGSSAMGFQEGGMVPGINPLRRPEGGIGGLLPPSNGGEPTQLFAEGGAVSNISEDDLTAMRNKVINDYGFDPVDIAMQEGVDPELFLRVMWTENRGRQGPVSNAGAIGLMQLMPGTAAELGVDPNDPVQNARGGARYLRAQLDTFGTVPLALAAYNAGPTRVRDYGGVPPFEETRNYIAQIYGVDVGEILPAMDQFFQMTPGADPSPTPQPRPTGLGTADYVPPEPVESEYLTKGLGEILGLGRTRPQPRPYIPNIMQQQQPVEDQARGIDFYRQYAAMPT